MKILKLIIYGILLIGAFLVASETAEPSNGVCSYISFSSIITVLYFGFKILKVLVDWTDEVENEPRSYTRKHKTSKNWTPPSSHSNVKTSDKPEKAYSSYEKETKITRSEKKQVEKIAELISLRTDISVVEFKKTE